MANQEHLDIIKQGKRVWNRWRIRHLEVTPDLSGADLFKAKLSRSSFFNVNLSKADLRGADLSDTDLFGADLSGANFIDANLDGANLNKADLRGAIFREVNLREVNLSETTLGGADLVDADLSGARLNHTNFTRAKLVNADLSGSILIRANFIDANLSGANLSEAILSNTNLNGASISGSDLSGADLSRAILVGTNLTNTTLKDCKIYGISAWDVQLDGAKQLNLTITPDDQATITVDNLKIAQFIYLLLNNKEIRDVIDTITSKVVLILGRFTPERKRVLDALREELRKRNYSPVLFDFEKPTNRDITETVSTLAHMARFVIADITEAKSIPQELSLIVPNLPSVPVQPLILTSQHEYGMFEHFTRFPWVLPVYRYTDEVNLLQSLQENVIAPAEQKAKELAKQ